MMHGIVGPMVEKKKENRIVGFSVRILDDETFTMKTDNANYAMEKEYSFQNVDELNKGIKNILGKIGNKSSHKEDELEKEKEY